jgi:tRNA-dihydrouridine synthase
VELRNELAPEVRIIGNGDALSLEDGQQKAELSAADGVMFGRAIFGNPWFFHPSKRLPTRLTALPTSGVNRETIITVDTLDTKFEYISLPERLAVLVEHTYLFCELLPHKSFAMMKKHYKAYVNGFTGAAQLRAGLMECNTPAEIEKLVHEFLAKDAHNSDILV